MIIVITGPTGVGKTKLSVELAKKYNAEIINADSMQVYKGLIWGKIVIDTVKENIVVSNLSKDSLVELETQISQFMMDAKTRCVNKTE